MRYSRLNVTDVVNPDMMTRTVVMDSPEIISALRICADDLRAIGHGD